MRIVVTADLHYDSPRSRTAACELARHICRTGGDAVVLVGDSGGPVHQTLRDCLGLFEGFAGRKFMVVGNHCLWCLEGEDSLGRYETIIPSIAAKCGFEVLDQHPARMGRLGLVGSVGWYDYSFRDRRLGIPLEFYRAKVAPGAARRLAAHRQLHESFRGRLSPRQYEICTRWMDGVHVKLGMSDQQFLDYLLARLRRQLQAMEADPAVRQIAAFVHHLPFAELVPPERPARLAFAAAYMGSARIGRLLESSAKLTHVFCGHSHWKARLRVGSREVINVGSTYVDKHLEVLEL